MDRGDRASRAEGSASSDKRTPRSGSPSNANAGIAVGSSAANSAGSSTTQQSSSGLLGWMKTAFASPLSQGNATNRTGSPASGRSVLAKWNSSSTSKSSEADSPSLLPSRKLEDAIDADSEANAPPTAQAPSPSRFASVRSHRAPSVADSQMDINDDDYDDDGEDDDDDEELYEPFQQQQQQQPQDANAAAVQESPSSTSLGGLVRPTARRSVSLNHGGREDLIRDAAALSLESAQSADHDAAQTSSAVVDSAHTGVVVSDTGSQRKPPSLVLTPPDSRESAEITSPIAGWAGPSSSSPLPTTGSAEDDDENYHSRESIALGPRSAALRNASDDNEDDDDDSDEEESQVSHSPASPPMPLATREDWDEARSRTPKVFSDLYRPTSIEHVMTSEPRASSPTLDPLQAAAEIAEIATPTPRPSDPRPSAAESGASSSPKMSVRAPTPLSPGRLRLFGSRRRADSNAASSDGASIKDGVSVDGTSTQQPPTTSMRPTLGPRNPSNTSFWRRGRKPSGAAATSGSNLATAPAAAPPAAFGRSRHQLETSASTASGFSVEALENASDAMYNTSPSPSRASSIAPSEARSGGASSRRRSRLAKTFGLAGETGPKRYKSRAKNKPSHEHHFSSLYLAQELYLGIPTPSDRVTIDSAPSSRKPSIAGSSISANSSSDGTPQRPPLASMDSESSLNSTLSSTIASSTMSHSTVGSYGAHGKRNATWAMKFSHDGRYLAVAGQDMIVRVFAVLDTAQKRDLEVQESQIRAEILRRAERGMARGSRESFGSSGKGGEGETNGGAKSKPHKKGSTSATSQPLRPIPVFNSRPVREFAGHTSDVLSLDWSKGNFLLSSSMDKTVKIWHLSKPACLITFGHGDFVTSAVFHPKDDRFFLSGSLDGKLRLWNIADKRVQATAEVPGLITATSFSASGSTAIAGTFAGALLFYNTDDLSYQSSIAVRSSSSKNSRGRKITGIEAVNNITPSTPTPGNKGVQQTKIEELILISSNDSRVRVYSLTDKRLTAKYRGSSYLNRTSQIRANSADDTYVAAGSESGEVYVWDSARESAGFAAAVSKKTSGKSLRSANGSKSGPLSSQSYECWAASDHARPITVALLAPIKTHTHLTTSEDPVEMHSAIVSQGRAPSGTTALSALGLAGAFSAAMPSTLRPGAVGAPPPPGWDPCQNRIVVSVDESQIVRVWRAVREPHFIGASTE